MFRDNRFLPFLPPFLPNLTFCLAKGRLIAENKWN